MARDIELVTIDAGEGRFRDLSCDENGKLTRSVASLILSTTTRPTVVYRGVNLRYLEKRLGSAGEIGEATLFARLFYFGDKAKHFLLDAVAIEASRWLKTIDDCGPSTALAIFEKLAKLTRSKNPHIQAFCERNNEFVEYFKCKSNRDCFERAVAESGVVGLTYFSGLLHVAGNIGVGDKSISLSTSQSYSVARRFAGAETPLVITAVVRDRQFAADRIRLRRVLQKHGIPVLPDARGVFAVQREWTLRAGLLPHNMLGVYDVKRRKFIVNPHLFLPENSRTNIAFAPLAIEQSEFERKIGAETAFSGWFVDDGQAVFHGGRAKRE